MQRLSRKHLQLGKDQPLAGFDVESFIDEYYRAWQGTDEDRILSFYSDDVTVQIPGTLMQGKAALREQFVRPFIAAFPGNRHVVKKTIPGRDAVIVEFMFQAEHTGAFAGHAATHAHVDLPGCGVYECDPARRQITAARIYFDLGTLQKQILEQGAHRSSVEQAAVGSTATIDAPAEHLDLATVIAVSQTVSGEMVLERLLDTLMRTAVQHAGAERALLILSRTAEQRIVAEATTAADQVAVRLCDEPVTGSLLPETVLHYVVRARASVVLDDAAGLNPFSPDPYLARHHVRSVFCLPLMNQARLIGVLYLENRLAPRVFAPARTAVLKLLASQAAISIENSRLYRDLAERESRIRRMIDAAIIGIFSWHADGRVFEANGEFVRIIGHSREDLVSGRVRWTDFTLPEWRERDAREMEHLRRGGASEPQERELLRKDGTRVPVMTGGTMFEGSTNEGVAFVFDLTELKRAEQALRESERAARLVVNTIPGLVATLTPAGEVEVVNDQLVEYCGQPLEAMRQWGTNGTVLFEDLPRVAEVFTRGIASGEPYEVEGRIRRFDGVYRWFQIRGLPLRDSRGQVVRWYSLLSDIDDRKRAEVELRQAYDSFVDAQRLSKTGSFITDLVGDDHNWSAEAYRIFDFDPTTRITVQRVRDVIHPDDLLTFESVIARGMAGENVTFVFRIVTCRGAVKHVRGVAHVIGQNARHPLFIGALQDVTESVVAEENLNRARSELAHVARAATLSALTASIAHEVNQPLSGIVTNASTCLRMLASDPPDLEGARLTARRTIRDGNRASEVIQRLRAMFARRQRATEPVDLSAAAREVLALSASELRRARVATRTELAEGLPAVRGDRVQLQQVILNLVLNAADALRDVRDRPRNLAVTTARGASGEVTLSVHDEGVGIKPEHLHRLFDAFFTTKGDGMGIGLSISRSIIEAHEGRLWANANPDGPGMTFSFSLPVHSISTGSPPDERHPH
jgi:PAS domain S-box-containing protein